MKDNPFASLLEPSDKQSVHTGRVKLNEQSGRYRIGAPSRPDIKHDNGHLDKFPPRAPTKLDIQAHTEWAARLMAAKVLCRGSTATHVGVCHNEDQSDALEAYRHFLFGNGEDRFINYERFLHFDNVGKMVLPKLLKDFQNHIEILGHDRVKFSVTSEPYLVGGDDFSPMPNSVNWLRTLGGHNLWVSADIKVSVAPDLQIVYDADIVIHVEDRYNFNPGQRDTSTKIPDAENGRFEITGLAKQYNTYAIVRRHLKWKHAERGSDWFPAYELTGGPMALPTSIEGEPAPLSTREPADRKKTAKY